MNENHPKPVSKDNASYYTWGSNCEGWRFVDHPELSVIQEKMSPDSSEVLHFHERAKQFFFILTGSAEITLDGKTSIIPAGAGIEIPARCQHQIRNPGPGILEFLLVSQPNTEGDRIEI